MVENSARNAAGYEDRTSHVRTDDLAPYFRLVAEHFTACLTRDGEIEYVRRRDEARENEKERGKAIQELVEANLRLVVTIAKRYRHRGSSLDELIAAGNEGLVMAARHYDLKKAKGIRFAGYAGVVIANHISESCFDNASIKLTPYFYEITQNFRREIEQLSVKLGKQPIHSEIAQHMKISHERVSFLFRLLALTRVDSLESPLGNGDGNGDVNLTLYDLILDTSIQNCVSSIEIEDRRRKVRQLFPGLTGQERWIVECFYGFKGKEWTDRAISRKMRRTRERARQIRAGALVHGREILQRGGIRMQDVL